MNSGDELALVEKIKQGDRVALAALWDECTPKLFGYLVNTTRNRELAEDILQTAWLKAIQNIADFQPRGMSISGWLFAIARNECRQQWRKADREVPLALEIHDTAEPPHYDLETT